MWQARVRSLSSRFPLLVVLLSGVVALMAAVALQAHRAIGDYRTTTERILGDYADLAASSYAARIAPELEYYAFAPPLSAIAEAIGKGGGLPEPRPVEVATSDSTRLSIDLVRTNVRVPLEGGALETAGAGLPASIASWLADTLRASPATGWRAEWSAAALIGPPGARISEAVPGRDRSPADEADARGVPVFIYAVRDGFVTGFVAKLSGLAVYFDYALGIRPLLPPALTEGTPQDSLVSVVVSDAAGHVLYRSERAFESRYSAQRELGQQFGGLRVRATLHPAAAAVLLVEGPPRSLPATLAGLSLLAAALLSGAVVIIRREGELARARTDFLASVSHELRTPLAQIRLFVDTLLHDRARSPDERRRALEIIDQEGRRLGDLIDNVLHVARHRGRPWPIDPEPTLLAPFLEEIASRYAPLAAERRARIACDLASGVAAPVDRDAVSRMVINLLDNAVKYGPEGQTIRLALEGTIGAATIVVEDEGPGIPAADRARICNRFVRLAHGGGGVAGAGIGLFVVRDVAERHGGRVTVDEAAGGGARFVVTLPGATVANPSPAP